MIKSEFSTRFAHTFRLYERLMTAFDADAWLDIGRGKITPARLALHLNQSMKYFPIFARHSPPPPPPPPPLSC